jgi:hypothetical protein
MPGLNKLPSRAPAREGVRGAGPSTAWRLGRPLQTFTTPVREKHLDRAPLVHCNVATIRPARHSSAPAGKLLFAVFGAAARRHR